MTIVNKSIKPYYDDFKKEKRFHNILFRPSYAVQTRELNQIQSIFQQQIEYFGTHVFKNGSVVIPGATSYDNYYHYAKIQIDNYEFVIDSIRQNLNLRANSTSTGIIANIIEFVDINGDDPATIFLQYISGGDQSENNKFTDASSITIIDSNDVILANATIISTGSGTKASIDDGVYFINGKFCLVQKQTIIVSKYSTTPDASIGLIYNEKIITENEDSTLVDNASGHPNYTAPGAHRLRVDLTLSNFTLEEEKPDDYIELIQLEGGILRHQARGPEYNVLSQTLAQRTYEESGDYSVKPFSIDAFEHLKTPNSDIEGFLLAEDGGDESKYVVSIDPGLAYVRGNRVESLKTINVDVDKARDTETANNSVAIVDYGYFIIVSNAYGIPIVTDYPQIKFYDGAVTPGNLPSGNVVGTALVRSIKRGDKLHIYISSARNPMGAFDTSFLSSAKSVYSTNGGSTFTGTLDTTYILNTGNYGALARLNQNYIKTLLNSSQVTDTSYTVSRKFINTSDANGKIVLSTGQNETFLPYNSVYSYVINKTTGELINIVSSNIGGIPNGSNITLDLGSINASKQVIAVVQIQKQLATHRKKSVVVDTVSGTPDAKKLLSLAKTDVYEIVSITDSLSKNVIDRFILEPNIYPDYYGISAVKETNGGVNYPITVQFKYFQHDSSGDYFSVDSYSDIDYKDIPTFNGESLANYIDFRPDKNETGQYLIASTDIIHVDSIINYDAEYYLPRIDKVFVNSNNQFGVVKGISALVPSEPATPENSMPIATISLEPYTINANDAIIKMIDTQRYTMSDIGALENRIENLEYYVSLSLLEQNTANIELYDEETGLNRFKNGFFVDSFTDSSRSDWAWNEYHVSVGAMDAEIALRPEYSLNAFDMEVNLPESSNIKIKHGLVTLNYTETPFLSQINATSTVNVNPYAVYRWSGALTLTPSADNWIDTVFSAPKVHYTVNDLRNNNANLQQSWTQLGLTWSTGSNTTTGETFTTTERRMSANDLRATDTFKQFQTSTTTTTNVEEIAEHIISRRSIPFIRSREIEVEINGMMPNTKHHFYFDNVNVSKWVKPTSVGANYGDPVFTDNDGYAKAIFKIPNNQERKFKTGSRLLQVNDTNNNIVENSLSSATGLYQAQGILETRNKEYNATRTIVPSIQKTAEWTRTQWFSNVWFDPPSPYVDPIAQSFKVETPGGVFVTSIDLFFAKKDTKIPIALDIRVMRNGFPSEEVVPGSEVILLPSQVKTSANGSLATTFDFKYAISLKQNIEYCFVLRSNSNKYLIWKATMSERDIQTNRALSKQPYIGVMFKSQNMSTWTEDQYTDLKFIIRRAKFTIGQNGVLVSNNKSLEDLPLENNPVITYNGNTYVDINITKGHNYFVGALITLSGLTGGNGLTAANLNKTHVVSEIISPQIVRITTGISANMSSRIGGNVGFRNNIIQYSAIKPNIEALTFGGSQVKYEIKPTTGKSFSGTETPLSTQSSYISINNKVLNYFTKPFLVLNKSDETALLSGNNSFSSRITLTSSRDNVSPVVDLYRYNFIAPLYLVDNKGTAQADGANSFAKYRTVALSIDNPTVAIAVYVDDYVPLDSEVVYSIRTANSSEELVDLPWTLVGTSSSRISLSFEEQNFMFETTKEFTWYQFMVQLKSKSCCNIPKVKNLRTIALGT